MKLKSHYVEKPWGRADLPPVFAEANGRKIGEVWFDDPDRKLPILVKWLFTSEKLSIQVHPNDEQAKATGLASGKEECWFIVSAEPDARLGIGTLFPLNDQELRDASLSGAIDGMMDWKPVQAGDYFYIPAGTVHAIGAGITLVEVQQNADVTYRLYDYGRPRELHLTDGVAVSDAKPYADCQCGTVDTEQAKLLVNGPHFRLWHARGDAIHDLVRDNVPVWVIPLEGSVTLGDERADAGACLYVDNALSASISAATRALVATQYPATLTASDW
jgi:mannose-6-phosphate isomerase